MNLSLTSDWSLSLRSYLVVCDVMVCDVMWWVVDHKLTDKCHVKSLWINYDTCSFIMK